MNIQLKTFKKMEISPLSSTTNVVKDEIVKQDEARVEQPKRAAIPLKGVSTLIGGLLVHLTLGSFYTYGNLQTYTTSYMRNGTSPGLVYSESFWVTPTIGGCQGLSMYFGGILGAKLGNRAPILLGAVIMSGANLVSCLTIKSSFGFFLFTYGVLQGIGVGFAYAAPLKICCQWFPDHKGLINGVIVAGFGSGGAIFNQIITYYLNPRNLKPSAIGKDNKAYFADETILAKVPNLFLILGAIYIAMQLIGLSLMFEPGGSKGIVYQFFSKFLAKGNPTENQTTVVESNIEKQIEEAAPQKNYTPREILKTWNFWSLYITFFCNGVGITYMAGFYKIFGQSSSYDDQYLATIGSLSSVANGLGRIMWGKIADKTDYKTSMVCVAASNMALMLSFFATMAVGKELYGFYVIAIFLAFSGTFSLMPTACARSFGLNSMTENYGLLFSSTVPQNVLSVLISPGIGKLEWYGQFWIMAGFYFVSFILAMRYPTQTPEGVKI